MSAIIAFTVLMVYSLLLFVVNRFTYTRSEIQIYDLGGGRSHLQWAESSWYEF